MQKGKILNILIIFTLVLWVIIVPQINVSAVNLKPSKPLSSLADPTLCGDGSIVTYPTTCPSREAYANPLYVTPGGNGDCFSWAGACSLNTALGKTDLGFFYAPSRSDFRIWVKQGIYYPTSDTDRSLSFALRKKVMILGGFAGTEIYESQRDPVANQTILSGDIGVPGDNSDNSYHVVKAVNVDSTGGLDGFVIMGGNANVVPDTNGGGIYLSGSQATLGTLFIHDNRAVNGGGGIYNSAGSNPYIQGLTLSNNFAGEGGGGMYNHFSSPTLVNVTFSGNLTDYWGGGMANYQSRAVLTNTTFSGNATNQPSGFAGGMFNVADPGEPTPVYPVMINTIIANSVGGDCLGFLESAQNNLIEDAYVAAPNNTTCELQNGVNGNQVGVLGFELGPLTNNGGISNTHALLPDSPARNAGINENLTLKVKCSSYDQRGQKRPLSGSDPCDIGSYESRPLTADPANTKDNRYATPGGLTSGDCTSWGTACSLEYAITMARAGDQVWVKAGTYKPSGGTRDSSIDLKNGIEIYGGFNGTETLLNQRNPGLNQTILSGDLNGDDNGFANNSENVYHVVNASGVNNLTILDGFTIIGGNADGYDWPDYNGGGILNLQGNPTLANLNITGNNASNGGGGMINDATGAAKLLNITFANNTEGGAGGGGLLNWNAQNITLRRLTFSGNSTTGDGGGLTNLASSTLVIRESTFSGNSATGVNGGGGLYNDGSSTVSLRSTLMANSTAGGDCVGTLDTSENSLFEDAASACGLTSPDPNGNILGVDPKLGPLANNGGFTLTHALLVGSPALDGGSTTFCLGPDQRGRNAPVDGNADGTLACDIGAFEANRTIVKKVYMSNGTSDGWILESTATSSKGGTMNTTATTINLGDSRDRKQYRSILSFNTSLLPDNAILTSVSLKLKSAGIIGGGNPVTTFGGFMVDFRKGSFGAASLELSDFQTAASKIFGTFKILPASGWYTINLPTALPYVNKLGLTQVRLRFSKPDNGDAIDNYLKIYSGNAGSTSRPKLIIQYYVP